MKRKLPNLEKIIRKLLNAEQLLNQDQRGAETLQVSGGFWPRVSTPWRGCMGKWGCSRRSGGSAGSIPGLSRSILDRC